MLCLSGFELCSRWVPLIKQGACHALQTHFHLCEVQPYDN